MKVNIIYSALLAALVLLGSCSGDSSSKSEKNKVVKIEIKVKKELVTFIAEDGLTVTADLYTHENIEEAPFIILFHQAGFSRGEYKETADKFLEMGYNCLAVDQRSGDAVNGVVNQTHLAAVEQGLPTEYVDAMPDLLGAITYIKDNFEYEKLVILGSSYSASLALIIASQNPGMVDAVLAFSPGEYFNYDEVSVEEFASEILLPVFISSPKSEHKKWKAIYEAIPDDEKQKFIPEEEGIHGSRALWKSTDGHKKCWEAVEKFLADE